MNGAVQWTVELADEAATAALAGEIAPALRPGDLVTLTGGLGAGKTAFARALIRHLSGDPGLEVPSPTFTLLQLYDTPSFPVVHADLYRIGSPGELDALGWDEAAADAVVLVEWPERAGPLPGDRLDLALDLDAARSPSARRAVLTGFGRWAGLIGRIGARSDLLARSGWQGARLSHLQGDASTRSYHRLRKEDGDTAVLMDAPPRTDRTPVRGGRTYSAIAHIAEDIRPFVALARALAERGVSAPNILALDLDHGLAVLEDLGSEGVVGPEGPVPECYAAAVEMLAGLHARSLPERLPVEPGLDHLIPPFDLPALEIEASLLLDWYLPHQGVTDLPDDERDRFVSLWRETLQPLLDGPRTWLLRDIHSPNLLWLPEREGSARIGVLDFQDAMIGSPAYDVASLCLDARVDVPQSLELQLLARYVKARLAADPGFDAKSFARDYAIMGAQRTTKILGIFARLDRRDGKPAYLRHLPRIRGYLGRTLAHPALEGLRGWYEAHLPDFRR